MAWSGADLALAHGNHCDPAGEPDLPEPGCNINGVTGSSRYFASQFGNNQFPTAYSNGIRGYLSVADVSMRDFFCNDFVNNQNLPGFNNPKCDFLLNGLVMTTWQNDNFAQIAFVEGAVPWPPANFNSSTPKLVTEAKTTCFGKQWFVRSTPTPTPRYNEFVGVEWLGQTGSCGGGSACFWWYERSTSFAPFDVTFLTGCQGTPTAQTEHFDNTHMEPNGLQCFGAAGCTPPTYGYDLILWNQSGGYNYLWDTNIPPPIVIDTTRCIGVNPQCGSGYTWQQWQHYFSARTTGQWP